MKKAKEHENERPKEDWAAMFMVMKVFEQIAVHGHGKRTILSFARAVIAGERGTPR